MPACAGMTKKGCPIRSGMTNRGNRVGIGISLLL
jgi:hypothetical protein